MQGQLRNLLRVHLCGRATVGMNAICDLDDDGSTMRYRFSQFCPMLGGQCKFHILYDDHLSQLEHSERHRRSAQCDEREAGKHLAK